MSKYLEIGRKIGAMALTADNILESYGAGDFKKLAAQANIMIAVAHSLKEVALKESEEE